MRSRKQPPAKWAAGEDGRTSFSQNQKVKDMPREGGDTGDFVMSGSES